jgi:sulfur dioxygenase
MIAVVSPRYRGQGMDGFRQMFDPQSSTLSYMLSDRVTRDAAMIDPVDSQFNSYSELGIARERLTLRYVLDIHQA